MTQFKLNPPKNADERALLKIYDQRRKRLNFVEKQRQDAVRALQSTLRDMQTFGMLVKVDDVDPTQQPKNEVVVE